MSVRMESKSRLFRLSFVVFISLFLLGCSMHPLGISDEEWNQLTPEQKLEAHKQEEANRLERMRLRQEEEKRRQQEQKRREKLELEQDLAAGMLMQYHPEVVRVIGGKDNDFQELILSLQRPAYVDKVVFHADDLIGRHHEGKLAVYADGVLIKDRIDIKKRGKWHQVLVARLARNISFRAVDDEVHVNRVKVYGSWVSQGDRQYYYFR
jgi:hypothetical protein